MEKKYLLGNDAIAYGLLEGGLEASFAYPGTPSSEIAEKLIELSKPFGFYAEWSINEKTAYENAYGVSLTGRRAAVIMKHVGLNVASDAFITSAYTGVRGGLVLVIADDPFAHSSQNEQDSRRYAAMAKIPCMEPSSVREAKEMAAEAFPLSEKTGLPVMLRTVTRISHGKSDVIIGEIKRAKIETSFRKDPMKFVMVPANARTSLKRLNEKQEETRKLLANLPFNAAERRKDATGIAVSGISYEYVREVREKTGMQFSILKISSYPLPEDKIRCFIKNKKDILVLEEGDPVVEENLYLVAKKAGAGARIHGKLDKTVPAGGELSLELTESCMEKLFKKTRNRPAMDTPALPARMPVLCPGCSHLGSFYILKKVFGKDAIFPGDIGCYTLGVQTGAIDTCLCMGAGINTGSGISRFEKKRPVVSIIGDSTFFHAGITGLINACYNRANQVIAILDNRTTAMTGHQPNPGTGMTAAGGKSVDIDLEKLAYACGADTVVKIDPYLIEESVNKLRKLKDAKGVRVVIAKQGCLFTRKKKNELFAVDAEKCRGCKICMEIKCPAISFSGGKAGISVFCNGCGMCAQICPFDAIDTKEK